MLNKLKKELLSHASHEKAKILPRFFKAGPGEYAEGDKFIGVTVPDCRKVAKKHESLSLSEIKKHLSSGVHEERLVALLILVEQFQAGNETARRKIHDFYLKNTKYINNWDLVDLSADKIVGEYIAEKSEIILKKLAKSKNLWERRIAIISTFNFIKKGNFKDTLEIAEILLNDKHDLIHKACGWMLREVGKRSVSVLESFLKRHYKKIPRTTLRYAIERFDKEKRESYLRGRFFESKK